MTLAPLTGLAYEKVAAGLAFPVFVDSPVGDDRLFVATKDGRIHIIKDGTTLVEPFLDISEPTNNEGERGLFGLAFHPEYATIGLFYVHYSDRHGDTKVFEYRVGGNPDLADLETARLIFLRPNRRATTTAACSPSAPTDTSTSLGDGGGGGDRYGNGQRTDTLLGALLRLDVDGGDPVGGIAMPSRRTIRSSMGVEPWRCGPTGCGTRGGSPSTVT